MNADEIDSVMQAAADAVAGVWDILALTRLPDIRYIYRGDWGAGGMHVTVAPLGDAWGIRWAGGPDEPRRFRNADELRAILSPMLQSKAIVMWRGVELDIRVFDVRTQIIVGREPASDRTTFQFLGHQDMFRAFMRDEIPLALLVEYLAERDADKWAALEVELLQWIC
jgi:hypothetical protein